MKNNRIRKDESRENCWFVDLSPINPDFYWHFKTRELCENFVTLIDAGLDVRTAYYMTKLKIKRNDNMKKLKLTDQQNYEINLITKMLIHISQDIELWDIEQSENLMAIIETLKDFQEENE
jgi:hypothetical protein